MRPAQIRVFDGLRLTTEHLNHLQEAWRSSVRDLREVAGLGRTHRGFDVSAGSDHGVTVQAGLGFDLQGNRVVLDEPATVTVTFGAGEDRQFVCLKHEQVEDGKVEGQSTLIWERGTVVLRPSLPGADDNLIVLAEVRASPGGGVTIARIEPSAEPEAGATAEPPTAAANGPAPGAAVPQGRSLEQGLLRLGSQPAEGIDLAALLIEPLRGQLAAGNGADAELRFPLFDAQVAVGFAVLGVSCHTMLSTVVTSGGDVALRSRAVAHGEASFGSGGVSQFGLASIDWSGAGAPGSSAGTVDATDHGIAQLPLATGAQPNGETDATAFLRRLAVRVQVEAGPAGFRVACHLVWTGSAREELLTRLASDKPSFRWEGVLGWKAQATNEETT